jgi:hypothetical protein
VSARTYNYITNACVLGVIAAAFLYGQSETKTVIAVTLGATSAVAGSAAYFLRLLLKTGSPEPESRQEPPVQREEVIQDQERRPALSAVGAASQLDKQALEREFVNRVTRRMLQHYYSEEPSDMHACVVRPKLRHSTVRYLDISRYFELSVPPRLSFAVPQEGAADYILDFATRLYTSEAGRDIECELTRDGTLVIRHNSKNVIREAAKSGDEEAFLNFGEENWPHLSSKPV